MQTDRLVRELIRHLNDFLRRLDLSPDLTAEDINNMIQEQGAGQFTENSRIRQLIIKGLNENEKESIIAEMSLDQIVEYADAENLATNSDVIDYVSQEMDIEEFIENPGADMFASNDEVKNAVLKPLKQDIDRLFDRAGQW